MTANGKLLLKKNEIEANRIVSKIMKVCGIAYTLTYILNLMGIFIIPHVPMTIAYVLGMICIMIPIILIDFIKSEQPWVKYVCVAVILVFLLISSSILTYHIIVLYGLAVGVSSLYFSKKMNYIVTLLSIVVVSIGQILGYYLAFVADLNFDNLYEVIMFSVIPRALTLYALSSLFILICERTNGMLENLASAEEQKKMLEYMNKVKEQATDASNILISLVKDLSEASNISSEANQSIISEVEVVLRGTADNTDQINKINSKMGNMSLKLDDVSDKSSNIAQLAKQIKDVTRDNRDRMIDATNSMEKINNSTDACKKVITKLGVQSNEIIEIVDVITQISDQTKILSLNASIEAARAGENGKGFAVVAEEIQKLSEQTRNAVDNIGAIIRDVVDNTEAAVVSMDESVKLTKEGMDNIIEAEKSAEIISDSNIKMSEEIVDMDGSVREVLCNGKDVSDGISVVSENIKKNYEAVEHVTAVTQESGAMSDQLVQMVKKIKGVSNNLLEVVQGAID